MRSGKGLVLGVALVVAGLAVGAFLVTREVAPPPEATLSVSAAMRDSEANSQGFARALEPREFRFPEDHGPHPEFRTEWWYWTGNLETADGHAFGYQFTVFRSALAPRAAQRDSEWGSNQLYMVHFALSDIGGGRFHAFERFSREALGLAGAQAQPFRVWLERWEASAVGEGLFPMRLTAEAEGVTLSLTLEEGKPLVHQGNRGLSQKGPQPGDASYYYSFTRMPSRGTVTVEGRTHEVTGLSWMDREWSTSALGEGQVGWDWFAFQLSDGSELMYGQLRRTDGSVDPFSVGTFVPPQGAPVRVPRDEVRLEVLDTWHSPRGGTEYPARWRLSVPARQLSLDITPAQADQELPLSIRYWEGAVRLQGTSAGQPVTGRGYVELTGYGDTPGQVR
ncbi:lipocalin-like domain-containing protein [Hyalangium rubrum]|uniref:Lipocalin-like domain-containing protein n=1 Tax=Hyalangium rubrum TaxID=3103134 RepID=A0ABU5H2V9_9BACT|nr:lipocalin-like domain-containing protein [Hyalangium sp. s54d21]MDY7227792.1 lipocalin-like domain-containing protein [Hyalangium sp. s54d21]